jgi:hypothetical protein
MRIELLYFDGCPSWQDGRENLKDALEAEGLEAHIRLVKVADDNDAEHLKFFGSPSFRVNGVDLWPDVREQYSLSCRVYLTPEDLKGTPTVDMLREQLRTFNTKI